MANSLDLDPEWGAIDLLEEVEQTFGIQIAKEEAEQCATVGDLYDVICAHSPDWDGQDGKCGSSMVFYRMRRSLSPDDKRGVTPRTPLAGIGLEPSRLFKKLEVDTGLRLPGYELTWLGMTGGFLMGGGIIAAVVALLTGQWIASGTALLVALAGLPLVRADPGRLPAGFATLADLVRRTVPLNATGLREAGGRPADRWAILTALAAEHGNLAPDKIGPETFFHRKSLKLANAR
ncbi:hypothetical protein VF10_21550 [Nostoc linckia z13]|uniref:acyl carrier protein n=1 Tax=Nostoc linckia TaxID=92942 RepID=UPI000BFFAA59|nr:acyl carrier protein [Nostoc linckia]PHK19530.1 hypothetical protein VF10_21550 [Nostoc linckia z13]